MGALATLFERRQSPENPTTNLANAAFWLIDALGGGRSKTGLRVNPKTALSLTPVYAAVTLVADTVGSLPLIVYERLQPRGKRRATEHSNYELLHDQPNPEMTAPLFFETMQAHLLLWGNAYAEIQRNGRGDVVALWPLLPDRTRVSRREDGAKFYITSAMDGEQIALGLGQVLHIPGLTFNGREGLSPIALAREAFGIGLAAEEYEARFFSNHAQPGGILEHPGKLSDPAAKRLKESWQAQHGGLQNVQRMAILEEGMKWQSLGMPHRDAQFMELRKFQVAEYARMFRVPPWMIGDVDRTTSWGTGIEQQGIGFVVYGLRRYLVRWEKAISGLLFPANQRGRFFAEFLVDGLLRGDVKSRYEAYAIGKQWGWLSDNDILELENRNPIEGGDRYYVPLNMIPSDQVPSIKERIEAVGGLVRAGFDPVASLEVVGLPKVEHLGILPVTVQPENRPSNVGDDEREDARAVGRRLHLIAKEAASRIVHRELTQLREKASKFSREPHKWTRWLEEFYAEHARAVADYLQLEPAVVSAYAEAHRKALVAEGLEVLERWAIEAPAELLALALMTKPKGVVA